jgi:dTMP kinase
MARGVFISFEGGEGCGKSTQIQRLAERLRSSGHRVLQTREPGGTEIGEQLRDLLQHSKTGRSMTSETELLLFAASRAQLVREVITPAMADGVVVLADRFLDSTTVYQGVARRLDPAQVAAINAFAVGSLLPDLTFLLDVAPEIGRHRMLQRTLPLDRMESQSSAFYEAVRAGYLSLAREHPTRICLIDGAAPVEMIASKIWAKLALLLSSR